MAILGKISIDIARLVKCRVGRNHLHANLARSSAQRYALRESPDIARRTEWRTADLVVHQLFLDDQFIVHPDGEISGFEVVLKQHEHARLRVRAEVPEHRDAGGPTFASNAADLLSLRPLAARTSPYLAVHRIPSR